MRRAQAGIGCAAAGQIMAAPTRCRSQTPQRPVAAIPRGCAASSTQSARPAGSGASTAAPGFRGSPWRWPAMSKLSRNKGAGAERELAAVILDELGVRLLRRLEQTRSGGYDLDVHPDETGPVAAQIRRYALEVKRHTKALPAQVRSWWAAGRRSGRHHRAGALPCLPCRPGAVALRGAPAGPQPGHAGRRRGLPRLLRGPDRAGLRRPGARGDEPAVKALYTFQEEAVNALRRGYRDGHRCQLLALATGAGKTVVATHMIRSAAQKGRTSMFVVAQLELIEQTARHLDELGLKVGVLQGGQTALHPDDECTVASIQTVRSRGAPPAGFVIIDEAHVLHRAHIDLMCAWDAVPFIGLSATPLRPDLGRHFTHLVRGPSIAWLTEHGFLVPVRAFCPSARTLDAVLGGLAVRRGDFVEAELAQAMNRTELVGDIVRTWQDKGENRPTLAFAVSIEHSKAIVADFQAAGVQAAHLDAYTPKEARKETIAAFRAGNLRVLSSVNVLGIGFDVPDAACAILARPTLSEALHMQQMGRVIRKAQDKAEALILDHAGNTVRFGLPQHFQAPDLGGQAHQTELTESTFNSDSSTSTFNLNGNLFLREKIL